MEAGMGMGVFAILLLVSMAVYIGAALFLAVAAGRVNTWWGVGSFVAFLFGPVVACLNGMVFAIRHWQEGGVRFLTLLCSSIAMVACFVGLIVSNPKVREAFWHGYAQERARQGHPVAYADPANPQAPHEAHDLAENEEPSATPAVVPVATPPPDPYAVQRTAVNKRGTDLMAEFQKLNTERTALKPGNKAAVAVFNAKAAHYQHSLQALQAEQARLDALDHPGQAAVGLAKTAPEVTTAAGAESEAKAALLRLYASVSEGNYAGFAATLRKCLADYRQTAAFPQIAIYAQQVLRDTSPVTLGNALQQQAKAAQIEYETTVRQVQVIVNQTPPTVVPPQGAKEVYHYGYHPGAIKPDFSVADVVTGREAWNGEYVYMDTRPGVFYRSADCEFNPQTKYFITNRDLPKKKLTDAENTEIVRLYRILGKDETILGTLTQRLAKTNETSAELLALNTQLGKGGK